MAYVVPFKVNCHKHWHARMFPTIQLPLTHGYNMQVDGGHFDSNEECKEACKQLATRLGHDQAPAKSSFRVLAGQQFLPDHSRAVFIG